MPPPYFTDFHGKALDGAHLQIILDRSHPMWIHLLHVRLARPRESHIAGSRAIEVRYLQLVLCWW